ncbi:biotin-dependent carboxyltransferase family protein [Rhodococcus sp. 1139]|uniref:5-oxoprolinase subunit C family protein n=1 Tax=Rhodococcus sp. 1139 TaxID=1833762 RepID=UPI000872F910|nr:biotin-dependent carboxyltransferase family protein [Rhodococcus sp. 1139]OFE06624.1 allophanate hydrolase [Rhodococcus sp. 1139]
MAWLEVVRTGPLATVQDRGRRGYGALGVGRSGAVDMISHDSANRLVGNTFRAATIEVTAGGFAMRAVGSMTVAATGARVPLAVDGRPAPDYASIHLGSGSILELDYSTTGLRTYISARGGVDVPQVLGSRSTDTLSGLGPPPLAAGDLLLLGAEEGTWPTEELIPPPAPALGAVPIEITLGPRNSWFTAASVHALLHTTWKVTEHTNRVGVRLQGQGPLHRSHTEELPSEGVVTGSIQVPPGGQPVVFLADHPVTGGYPVIAVVSDAGIASLAQLRPGSTITFKATTRPS